MDNDLIVKKENLQTNVYNKEDLNVGGLLNHGGALKDFIGKTFDIKDIEKAERLKSPVLSRPQSGHHEFNRKVRDLGKSQSIDKDREKERDDKVMSLRSLEVNDTEKEVEEPVDMRMSKLSFASIFKNPDAVDKYENFMLDEEVQDVCY